MHLCQNSSSVWERWIYPSGSRNESFSWGPKEAREPKQTLPFKAAPSLNVSLLSQEGRQCFPSNTEVLFWDTCPDQDPVQHQQKNIQSWTSFQIQPANMKTFQVSAVFSRFFFCRYFSLYRFRAIVSCCPFNLEVLHIFIVSPLRPSSHTAQRQFGESFTALSGSLAYTKVFQVLKLLFSSG